MKRSNFINVILIFFVFFLGLYVSSCTTQKRISHTARIVLDDPSLKTAHLGICIYAPATGKYLYNYNGDKYFVPASNTKIPTCYAAMKYLGDSLPGLQWQDFSDTAINILATGDPSFLHSDFKNSPVLDFLKKENRAIYLSANWKEDALGLGWSWDDYNSYYMAERSPLPVYGNIVHIKLDGYEYELLDNKRHFLKLEWQVNPIYFRNELDSSYILPPDIASRREMADSSQEKKALLNFAVLRERDGNKLRLVPDNYVASEAEIPFNTEGLTTSFKILKNDLGLKKLKLGRLIDNSLYGTVPAHLMIHTIRSQPTDSLLRLMMHRSDNFFAEQSLLMVSNAKMGIMNDRKIIDTLLGTDFKELPQRPGWVDGSGLSRFNLFSPQDMVFILNKIKNEFGIDRIKIIFPTGGEGTLYNYYRANKDHIYAKTGSLTGVLALSGYLYTRKNKLLIFSILVNNHRGSATDIRKAIEKFLQEIMARY